MHLDDFRDTVAPTPEKVAGGDSWRAKYDTSRPSFFEGESGPVTRYPADCPEACNEKSAKPNDMKIGPWLVFLMSFLLVFLLLWFVIIGAMELLYGN
ncbi:MAG TPA: hypothetical protein DCZ08_13890 [Anaerolineaceae bacterium]|nr:hypothetical protein [Anaerolineaceae bacterium]